MANDEPAGWQAEGAEIKLNGRLYGLEADVLRAASAPGDSPTDAIKRLLASNNATARRELQMELAFKAREAALLEAGQLREDALRAEIAGMAKMLAAVGLDLTKLVNTTVLMSRHVALMQSAQADTAGAAKTAVAECVLIRQEILSALPELTAVLSEIGDQTAFLNSFFHELGTGAGSAARSLAVAES